MIKVLLFFYYSTIINTLLLGSIEKSGEINARNYYSKKVKWYDMALVKFGEKISQENLLVCMWGKKTAVYFVSSVWLD